jgi:DNA-binding transcriptional LysR family regulator
MALNLNLLRLFEAVARHGGFSRAAEALRVSQPAVSKGVRELEAQVGSRLLERGPKGIATTEAGAALRATALFAIERAAEEDLAAFRGLSRGSLTIGASTTIGTYMLPPLLGAFHRAHRHVELRLRGANTSEIADLMLARELDIALVEGPVDRPGVTASLWRHDEMVVVAAPTHRLARLPSPVERAALREEIFLAREPGSGTREVAFAALEALGAMPSKVLEVGATETVKQVAAAGLGVSLISASAAADQLALGKLVAVEVAGLKVSRALSLLRLADRQPSAASAAFDKMLRAAALSPA